MGVLHKDLKDRNVVYDEFIKHFKEKMSEQNKDTSKNEWLMETYDNEVKKADRGDAYLIEKSLAHGFSGLATGLVISGIAFDQPVALIGALGSVGLSLYNYIRFKNLTLGRGLGTRMFYAETLQKLIEENNFKYPFNSGEMNDYSKVEEYVNFLNEMENSK